jgi:hypothetical protein
MKNLKQELLGRSKRKFDILFSFGANLELDTSLTKLIQFQIAKYRAIINQTQTELAQFEKKYHLSSDEFFKRFESGKIGDDADFFDWAGLYENVLLYNDRIRSLEATLKSD